MSIFGEVSDESQNSNWFDSGEVFDARQVERHRPLDLVCSMGEVADLSSEGMRIRCMGKCIVLVGQFVDLKLQWSGRQLIVKAWIRWVKKLGFHRYDLGVQFIDLAEETVLGLSNLIQIANSRGQNPSEVA